MPLDAPRPRHRGCWRPVPCLPCTRIVIALVPFVVGSNVPPDMKENLGFFSLKEIKLFQFIFRRKYLFDFLLKPLKSKVSDLMRFFFGAYALFWGCIKLTF